MYTGTERSSSASGLAPFTDYTFRVRAVTDGEDGAFSEPVTVTTLEAGEMWLK